MEKIKNLYFLLILFIMLLQFSLAREILSWPDAVRLTNSCNYTLKTAREKINEAELKEKISQSSRLPQIDSSAGAQRSGSAVSGATDPGLFDSENIRNSQSLSVSGKQLVFDAGKTKYNIESAKASLQKTEFEYLVTESNVRLNLNNSFYGLLHAQELLLLSKEIAQRRQQQYELVKLRYEAGLEHKGSLLTAAANLEKALLDIKQAARAIELNQKTLANNIGITLNTEIITTGSIAIKTKTEMTPNFYEILETTPFLKELAVQIEQAQNNLAIANAAYFPQVYASGSLGKNFNQTYDNETETDNWSLGLNLSYTLFDGAKRNAEKETALSQLRQAEINKKNSVNSLLLTMEENWLNLLNSLDNISLQEKYLAAASARSTIAEAQYSSGLITFDNWTIIEDALVSAQKNYLSAQRNALQAEANWIQAKGGTLNEI